MKTPEFGLASEQNSEISIFANLMFSQKWIEILKIFFAILLSLTPTLTCVLFKLDCPYQRHSTLRSSNSKQLLRYNYNSNCMGDAFLLYFISNF